MAIRPRARPELSPGRGRRVLQQRHNHPAQDPAREGVFRLAGVSRDNYRLSLAGLPEGTYVKSVRLGGQEALDKVLDLR
jgi:hypothetical protein